MTLQTLHLQILKPINNKKKKGLLSLCTVWTFILTIVFVYFAKQYKYKLWWSKSKTLQYKHTTKWLSSEVNGRWLKVCMKNVRITWSWDSVREASLIFWTTISSEIYGSSWCKSVIIRWLAEQLHGEEPVVVWLDWRSLLLSELYLVWQWRCCPLGSLLVDGTKCKFKHL